MVQVVRAGSGPRMLLVHGSAADHTTWSFAMRSQAGQRASSLGERFTVIAYDRRADATTVEDHAADAIELLASEPAIVVGSSFGAVIALEVIRRVRQLGAVLIEPPLGATDDAPAVPAAFVAEYDRRAAAHGGPAAAELFLRTVLGDAAYERMPRALGDRSKAKHAEIRADSAALLAYRPRYRELSRIATPVLLLGGERSAAYFRPTLHALLAALPDARLEIVAAAGHMLHAEAPHRFADAVIAFAQTLGLARA